ncbi:MAG: cation:dicarboxylase symporter family transporter [Selenomonadaceae bacterium]|nr:cation:dicarboxylase symporter family transporter [Selenomonadaceae bacterium]
MKLSNQNINDAIEEIQKFFDSLNVPRKDKIRISLLLEEALLRYQEKFGEDYEFKLVIRKWFGTPKVLIKIKGTPYNPIEDNDDEQLFSEMMIKTLMSYEQAGISYRYENGTNEISAFSTKKVRKKLPVGLITLIIIFPIILGFLCRNFSAPVQNILVENVVTPLLSVLTGTLIAVTLPLIFISIAAGICAVEDVTILHDVGTKILKRFFALMFLIAFFTIIVSAIFFPVINFNFEGGVALTALIDLTEIYNLILSIMPQGIFQPFIDKNILQIVSLGFITGICITILGNRVKNIKNFILEFQQLTFKIIEIVFKLIPLVIFLYLFKMVLIYSADEILSLWRIIAAKYVLFSLTAFFMLLHVSIKYGIKISDFIKKIYPALIISFKSASGILSLEKNLELCKKELKVEKNLCDFYIPISHTLFPSTMVISIVVNLFFAAHFSGEQISVSQIFILTFLAVQFAISSAGGNGGMIAIMSILLTQMHFSLDSIGAIALSDVFTVNFSCAIALIIRDCDLFDLSHKVKFR